MTQHSHHSKLQYVALVTLILSLFQTQAFAQLPNPAIVGYWENWKGNRFVALKNIDPRYNVINIAFATPKKGTDYDIELVLPYGYTEAVYKSEIEGLQKQGKKVLISIGGQNHHVILDTEEEKKTFVSSVNALVDKWGFDGVDIDLEGKSLEFSNINIQNPQDPKQIYLISAIKEILANHKEKHGKKLLLTMAPETIYVQAALSKWAGKYRGAYLPIIEALKDDIDMLNVQLYNSGSMFGLDGASGGEFKQSTTDFIVAMTEAVIKGFKATGNIGTFSGIPASKVGVGLPGCEGWGYTSPKNVEKAIAYLRGKGSKSGRYTLKNSDGYPDLRGMMVWSINSDKNCSPSYGYVENWEKIFVTSVNSIFKPSNPINKSFFYPNPALDEIQFHDITEGTISIFSVNGELVKESVAIKEKSIVSLSDLQDGIYFIKYQNEDGQLFCSRLIKK
ncbi:MAG: T9SS type A sorting domain-containing protein [Cytophagales bacterium]|nr:T9SS type A sorting domain-containing protein [Cytophagales bacterium]